MSVSVSVSPVVESVSPVVDSVPPVVVDSVSPVVDSVAPVVSPLVALAAVPDARRQTRALPVDLTTLDALVQRGAVDASRCDLLVIDTEGNDPGRAIRGVPIMGSLEDLANVIEILDVRIKRADLPAKIADSVFNRMRTERERIAKDSDGHDRVLIAERA